MYKVVNQKRKIEVMGEGIGEQEAQLSQRDRVMNHVS